MVAISTTEAEYVAASEAARELTWIMISEEIGHPLKNNIPLYGEYTGSLSIAKNPELHQKTKHIAIRERYINSLVEDNTIKLIYVPTANMLADALTKPLPRDRHQLHWELLGLVVPVTPRKSNKRQLEETL